MKRKDYEDKYDDFSSVYISSPSAKSRRLDPDLLPLTNEEDPISSGMVSDVVEPLTSSTTEADASGLGLGLATTGNPPSSGGDFCNEKALVLYNPTNTPLFKSPTSPDFSVIVNSDLIPGLKDHLFLVGNSKMVKPLKDAMAKRNITDVCDDRLAVVPWVAPRAEPQVVGMIAATEAVEIEMMDTEDNSGGPEGVVEGAGGLQQWQQQQQQQHCLRPELFQNAYTPVI